jgi:hypothetical protein
VAVSERPFNPVPIRRFFFSFLSASGPQSESPACIIDLVYPTEQFVFFLLFIYSFPLISDRWYVVHKQIWVKHLPVSPIIDLTMTSNASGDDRLAGVAVVGRKSVREQGRDVD